MLSQEAIYSSTMNWVSGFIGRRASTPQHLHYGLPDSDKENKDGISYTSSRSNRRIIGQHSLDQSVDRMKEYKKSPKRNWKLPQDYIFPEMIGKSAILTDEEIMFLDEEKPERLVGCTWELVFSTELHGYLLSTLYRNIKSWTGPTLLVIKDKRGHRFGAYVTESFKPDDKIHGGGECFVFRLKHQDLKQLFNGDNMEEYESSTGDQVLRKEKTGLATARTGESLLPTPDSSTLNKLVVREEHFSSEEDGNITRISSKYSIKNDSDSSILKKSDIIQRPELSESEDKQNLIKNSDTTEKEDEIGERYSSKHKQAEFLKEHDITEHYVWSWAGENSCFIHGDEKFLTIGLNDGKVALNIDNMLEKGRSQATKVFDNQPLAPSISNKDGDFEIVTVEIWLFKQL